MSIRLEHANISVRDIDETLRFLTTAIPQLRVRRDVTEADGRRWVHVGTDDAYIALSQARETPGAAFVPYSGQPGINHLGWEVDDVEALHARLAAAGYRDSTYPNAHPHRTRVYFNDADGNDWEFVQYHSASAAERHDYELADRAA